MMRRFATVALLLPLAVGVLAAPLSLGRAHKDETEGYRIQPPAKWVQVPTKFQEVNLLAKWAGKAKRGWLIPGLQVFKFPKHALDPSVPVGNISGVELTSRAFASVVPWFPVPLALVVVLFAFSTMIAWSYYGLAGWLYLFGPSRTAGLTWNAIFCISVALGCMTQLESVLDFSDATVFAMALANVLGLYMLAPLVKRELDSYLARVRSGEIAPRRHRQIQ